MLEEVVKDFKYLIGEGYLDLKRFANNFPNRDAYALRKEHIYVIQDFYRRMLFQFTKNDGGKIPLADLVEVFICVLGECYKPRDGLFVFSIAHVEDFIRVLSPDELKAILDCLVERRCSYNTVHMKNINILRDDIYYEKPVFRETLVRYGFKYDFDDSYSYLYFLCDILFNSMTEMEEGNFSFYVDIDGLCAEMGGLRLQMALELLIAIYVKDENKKVVSLLWRSLPYPFITANELYDLLEPYHDIARLDLLRNSCDEFQMKNSIYPVPEVSQPRSLKHLSRVQIRKCLNEVNSLNDVTIQRLDIPDAFKVYLQLDAL